MKLRLASGPQSRPTLAFPISAACSARPAAILVQLRIRLIVRVTLRAFSFLRPRKMTGVYVVLKRLGHQVRGFNACTMRTRPSSTASAVVAKMVQGQSFWDRTYPVFVGPDVRQVDFVSSDTKLAVPPRSFVGGPLQAPIFTPFGFLQEPCFVSFSELTVQGVAMTLPTGVVHPTITSRGGGLITILDRADSGVNRDEVRVAMSLPASVMGATQPECFRSILAPINRAGHGAIVASCEKGVKHE